jgi:hypothetical protein
MSTDADKAVQITQVEMEYRVGCTTSAPLSRNGHQTKFDTLYRLRATACSCQCEERLINARLGSAATRHGRLPPDSALVCT